MDCAAEKKEEWFGAKFSFHVEDNSCYQNLVIFPPVPREARSVLKKFPDTLAEPVPALVHETVSCTAKQYEPGPRDLFGKQDGVFRRDYRVFQSRDNEDIGPDPIQPVIRTRPREKRFSLADNLPGRCGLGNFGAVHERIVVFKPPGREDQGEDPACELICRAASINEPAPHLGIGPLCIFPPATSSDKDKLPHASGRSDGQFLGYGSSQGKTEDIGTVDTKCIHEVQDIAGKKGYRTGLF